MLCARIISQEETPQRCSDTRGWFISPPFPWLDVLDVLFAPQQDRFYSPAPFTNSLHRVGRYSEFHFRKRFRCRRCQERGPGETESSRCLPGPSAVGTTKSGWGGSHKAWIDLTAPSHSSTGTNRLLGRSCTELKAHFSLLPSPQGSDKRGLFCWSTTGEGGTEKISGSGFTGGRGRNPSSGFTDREMQGQTPSYNSCSTFGEPHEVQGANRDLYCIYNPEQLPKPNSHQLVRHTEKIISSNNNKK